MVHGGGGIGRAHTALANRRSHLDLWPLPDPIRRVTVMQASRASRCFKHPSISWVAVAVAPPQPRLHSYLQVVTVTRHMLVSAGTGPQHRTTDSVAHVEHWSVWAWAYLDMGVNL